MKNKIPDGAMTNVADFYSPPPAKFISFKVRVAEIFKMKFDGGAASAFDFGIRRAEFEEKQYRLLVNLTDQATSAVVKSRRKVWQRGVEKSRVAQERFKFLIQKSATERNEYLNGSNVPFPSANPKMGETRQVKVGRNSPAGVDSRRKSEIVSMSPR